MSTIELHVPVLVKFLTKIPRVCLVFDASFLDTCNDFNSLNIIYLQYYILMHHNIKYLIVDNNRIEYILLYIIISHIIIYDSRY